jgi:uncharacterized protein (TIGR00299 family) protein
MPYALRPEPYTLNLKPVEDDRNPMTTSPTPTNGCTIAFGDCFSGISGDMFLGGLLDAGLDEELLRTELAKLAIDNYKLNIHREKMSGIAATRFEVLVTGEQPERNWQTIRQLIEESSLNQEIRKKALTVFSILAEAEARIHGCKPEEVHFHEVGGVDSIVDIVGAAIGVTHLQIEHLITSPLPMPRGWIQCAHGNLPLPPPAVCEILQGLEVYGIDTDRELVTPTGAALIKGLSRGSGQFPRMILERTGYGAGSHKPTDRPNLFRLVIGKAADTSEAQEIEVIETNLDDWSPEGFPYLMECLFNGGALDVSLVPIQMKKGRPGFLLRVIADPAHGHAVKRIIFSETTAIGLRFRTEHRLTLPRKKGTVQTPWGPVAVKKVETPRGPVLYPEYEACRKTAQQNKLSLQEVYTATARQTVENFIEDPE